MPGTLLYKFMYSFDWSAVKVSLDDGSAYYTIALLFIEPVKKAGKSWVDCFGIPEKGLLESILRSQQLQYGHIFRSIPVRLP